MATKKTPEELMDDVIDNPPQDTIDESFGGEEVGLGNDLPPENGDTEAPKADADEDKPDDDQGKPDDSGEESTAGDEGDDNEALNIDDAIKSPEEREADKAAAEKQKEEEEMYQEPEGLSEVASTRFKKLADTNKDLKTRNADLEQSSKVLADVVASFGNVQPQELQLLAGFSKDLKSGTPESLNRCWQTLQQYQTHLAKLLGKQVHDHDPLSMHPDLQAKVDNAELNIDEAMQQAEQRASQYLSQQHQQREQKNQQAQTFANNLKTTVNNMESSWKLAAGENYEKPLFRTADGGLISMKQALGHRAQQLIQQLSAQQINPEQFLNGLQTASTNLLNSLQSVTPQAPAKQEIDDYQPIDGGKPSSRRRADQPTGLDAMEQALGYGG